MAEGFWGDGSLGACSPRDCTTPPSHPFTVRSDRKPYRGTLGDVDALARRVAAGLRRRGIGPGDAVAFQLPNWLEAAATFYAVAYLGAVVVPIVHFYGPKEVGYILRKTRVKALVTADRFGTRTSSSTSPACATTLPDLEWVASSATHGDAADPATSRSPTSSRDDPIDAIPAVDPRAPALVAYTSGTTSRPEGCRALAPHDQRRDPSARARCRANRGGPAMITGAPVGHGIGMLAALLIPVYRRSEIHLIDVWDPGPRAAGDARRRPVGRPGLHVLPHEPARPSRLRPGAARSADAVHRPRRFGGPGRGRRAVRGARHRDRAQLRLDRAPVDHRQHARRAAREARQHRRAPAARRRDPPRRRRRQRRRGRDAGRDLEPRAGAASSATPMPPRPQPRSAPTAGS